MARGISLEVSGSNVPNPSPHCLPPLTAFQVAVRAEKQTCVAVNKQCFPNLYILSVQAHLRLHVIRRENAMRIINENGYPATHFLHWALACAPPWKTN